MLSIRFHFLFIAVAIIGPVALSPSGVWARSGGPPDGHTGAPGEQTCQACHSNGPDDGSMTIEGVPAFYEPGVSYSLTVTLDDSGQMRWGFEMTAINAGGDAAGEFEIIEPGLTQLSDNPGSSRDYVKQTSMGTYAGVPGPLAWTVLWHAPDPSVGEITFYAAGNAANNNGGTSGDNIYTATLTTGEEIVTPTGVPATPTEAPATATPEPGEPTATPTPAAGGLNVSLDIPATQFSPGDSFYLDVIIDNQTGSAQNGPLFVILDVFGAYYFWPSWSLFQGSTGLDYQMTSMPAGESTVTALDPFPWPDTGGDSVTGLQFYAAVLNQALTDLWSNLAAVQWGYGP